MLLLPVHVDDVVVVGWLAVRLLLLMWPLIAAVDTWNTVVVVVVSLLMLL